MGPLADPAYFVPAVQQAWAVMHAPLFAVPGMVGAAFLIGALVVSGLIRTTVRTTDTDDRKGV